MSSGLETIFLKAKGAERRGDSAEARRLLAGVLDRFPANRKAMEGIARLDQAATGHDGTLQAGLNALLARYAQGDHAVVASQGERLLRRFPDVAPVLNLLGAAYLNLDEPARAEAAFRAAIRLHDGDASNHSNLGISLKRQGRIDEAAAAYARALEIRPDYVAARFNLGNLHRENRNLDAAVRCYRETVALQPDHHDALVNLGSALLGLGRKEEAIEVYRNATAIAPDDARTHYNLGSALAMTGALDQAHALFSRTLEIAPDHHAALAQRLYAESHFCDWRARDLFATLPYDPDAATGLIEPFTTLPFEDDPASQLRRSRAFASGFAPAPAGMARFPEARPGGRIRIGYFSADFHDHATLYLMAGLLREHDRERFEIRAYSFGTQEGGEMGHAIRPHLDAFIDIRDMTDAEAVDLARSHALDIAVDLKGYTREARPALFAARVAPVQISYLGYPGSLGAGFMDYIVADPVVIPDGSERDYDERVIRLPGSYQANDNRRAIGRCPDDRTSLGLPEQGFVFCCFNQNYKISPREYDIWMRLLHQVEGSVLWLFRSNLWADVNLRVEAAVRGVDPDRIVFADKLPHADHLARHRHADLFLDTFAVNAHTTASDALWSGLPVLTLAGRQFAARVGASLLTAIGLPELIATSEQDYEDKALDLARSPGKLAAIRARLAANRLATPLFDTPSYTRHLEAAYAAAHQRRLEGLVPAHINIG